MAWTDRNLITVCPPNLDRSGLLALDSCAMLNRDWLLSRLSEGFQIRMLRAPRTGFIAFCAGHSSWVPMVNGTSCVVVQCFNADDGLNDLIFAAEEWARYFDFPAVIILSDTNMDLPGYDALDHVVGGAWLLCKFLQGPISLPRLPQNWMSRVAALGPGLVVQCTEQWQNQLAVAKNLVTWAEGAGIAARLDLIESAEDGRERLVCPESNLAVVMNGQRLQTRRKSGKQIRKLVMDQLQTGRS